VARLAIARNLICGEGLTRHFERRECIVRVERRVHRVCGWAARRVYNPRRLSSDCVLQVRVTGKGVQVRRQEGEERADGGRKRDRWRQGM
jgi:hypothetical protein